MYKLILKDIKSLYKSMIFIGIQMVVIFLIFFLYLAEYKMYTPNYARLKNLENANITVFDTLYQPIGNVVNLNKMNLFENEYDYLGNIIDSKKGYTYVQTQSIYGDYENLVIVGDMNSVLYNTDDEFVSGIYIGSDIKTDALKVGSTLNINSNDMKVLDQLPKNTYFQTQNTKLLLDNFTVLNLTWAEFFDAYESYYDWNCISNFALKDYSETEVAEFVNKFSEYPNFIIRERTKPIPYIYENLMKNDKLYIAMSTVMFIISSYTMMLLFGKKYKTILSNDLVSTTDGNGEMSLYIRITSIIAITFIVAFLISYFCNYSKFEFYGMSSYTCMTFFISVLVVALVEGYILFRKVKHITNK